MSTQFAIDLRKQKSEMTIQQLVNKARRRSVHIESLRKKDIHYNKICSPVKRTECSPNDLNTYQNKFSDLNEEKGKKVLRRQSKFLETFIKRNLNKSLNSQDDLGTVISKKSNNTGNSFASSYNKPQSRVVTKSKEFEV